MATGVVQLGQFETKFRVRGRPVFVGRRRSVVRGRQMSPVGPLAGLGAEEASEERQRLVDGLATLFGQERAEQLVADLEATVNAEASAGATEATKKVVRRGLWISAGLSAVTVVATYLASR